MTLVDLIHAVETAEPLPELPTPEERARLREAAGLSRNTAAPLIGVAPFTLSRWEDGKSEPQVANERAYRKLLSACARIAA